MPLNINDADQPATTLAQKNNNPGNLRGGDGLFRQFPSQQEGWDALDQDLLTKVSGKSKTGLNASSSLRDFAAKYAPASDKNDPEAYATGLAGHLGISPDTSLSEFSDSGKRQKLAHAIANMEGFFKGRQPEQGLSLALMSQPSAGQLNLNDAEPEQVDYKGAFERANQPFSERVKGYAKGAGRDLFSNLDAIAGMVGPMAAKLGGPPGVGLAGLLSGGGKAASQLYNRFVDPQVSSEKDMFGSGPQANFPQDANEATGQITDAMRRGMLGQTMAEGLSPITKLAGKGLYNKLLRVNPDNPTEVQAAQDLFKKNIPLGVGGRFMMKRWKDPLNEAVDNIIDANTKLAKQPGLVPMNQAGAASRMISKTDIAKRLADHYNNIDPLAPLSEREAAIKAGDNFLHDNVPENMTLKQARKIKQNIQKSVPYGQETEGMQQGRKILGRQVGAAMEDIAPELIPIHKELERAINAEDILGKLQTKTRGKLPISPWVAAPIVGGVAGGVTGHYTHQNPLVAAGIGATTLGLLSPTGISAAALASKWLPQAVSIPTRLSPKRGEASDLSDLWSKIGPASQQ